MFNPKLIAIAAVCGLLLSFLSGVFSGVNFGVVLLRSFISALIAGGIAAGVGVLYKKFLEQTSDSLSAGSENLSSPGSVVDITLGDDDLQDDDSGPGFYVDPMAQKKTLSESHMTQEINTLEGSEDGMLGVAYEGVMPSSEQNSVSEHAKAADSGSPAQHKTVEKGSLDDELDELPDITALSREMTSSDEDMTPLRGHSAMHDELKAEPKAHDANLMAQAIRTILTKDG